MGISLKRNRNHRDPASGHSTLGNAARKPRDSAASAAVPLFVARQSRGPQNANAPSHGFGTGGAPLPSAVRAYFEPRFGQDFSAVRVHAGDTAAQETDRVGARAFAFQNHIWLGRGQPIAPSTLIAHELAHVVQGRAGAPDVLRRKEDWDFTLKDFVALRKGKGDLKISADSGFVPSKLGENILNTLRFALDAKRSPSATEGINPADFYHGHLIVPDNKAGLSIDAIEARSKYQKERKAQTIKTLGGEFENVTDKNVAAYVKAMQTTLPLLGLAMQEVMKIKGAAVMYHTYETTAVAKDIAPADPRRNIITPFDTNQPQSYHLPKGSSRYTDHYIEYVEFSFLVDQKGEVHVRPGGRDPLSMITGKPVKGPL